MALIGADGAGKTTVARALQGALTIPSTYIYMGVNWDASNRLLPTTRVLRAVRRRRQAERDEGGPPDRPTAPSPAPLPKRALRGAWSAFALANRVAEEWYRQLLAWVYVRRGHVVVYDRHFYSDYHAHDVLGRGHRTIGRHVHGLLLSRVYPKPDLVIFLDAPPEVLHARKGEGTLAALERRRSDYLELAGDATHFVTVDADAPLDRVISSVVREIEAFAETNAASPR